MSDLTLRRRQRAACGGDPQASARLLAEQVRQGRVDLHRLRLAAYADDDPAGQVTGAPAPPRSPRRWAEGLLRWGDEACARAAVGLVDLALPVWESWEPGIYAPGSHLRWARDAAQALLLVRSEEAWRVGDGALLAAEEAIERTRFHLAAIDLDHPGAVGRRAWRAVDTGWTAVCAVRATLEHLRGPDGRPDAGPRRDLPWAISEQEPGTLDPAAVREALAAPVRAWARATAASRASPTPAAQPAPSSHHL